MKLEKSASLLAFLPEIRSQPIPGITTSLKVLIIHGLAQLLPHACGLGHEISLISTEL
jgi:hypothetical protein